MCSFRAAIRFVPVATLCGLSGCGATDPEPIACSGFKPTPDLVSTPYPMGSSDEALERYDARVDREIEAIVRCKVFDGKRVRAIRDVYGEADADWGSLPGEPPPRTLVWGTPYDTGVGIEAEIDDGNRVITVRRWILPEQ